MAYRVLIIGCGAIAGGYDADRPENAPPLTHAGAFSADKRFELAACVDPDDDNRAAFAERWNVPQSAPSIDQLGADAGAFDVISICSPTDFHAEHLGAALALEPRLVFCEKPMAHDCPEAERLVFAYEKAGVALAVNYTRRWAPDLVALAKEVRAGEWGRVLSATGWYTKGAVHNGTHMADLVRMFVGTMGTVSMDIPVYDHWDLDPTVPALFRSDDPPTDTPGQARINVHFVAGDARAFTQFELVVTCEKGEIAMRDGGFLIETRRVEESPTFAGYRTLGKRESVPGRYEEAMTLAIANIADHLAHGKPLASTGKNALDAHALCEGLRLYSNHRYKDQDPT